MRTTVLVAEDEPMIAMTVMSELGEAGFLAVGPFTTTSQALAYCRKHTPDCAVLDLRLADGESYPLADFLAERAVPVIFYYADASPRDLAQRYPGVRVCSKPAPSSQLASLVAELSPPE
jgi:CheY-like chemotaxis protein